MDAFLQLLKLLYPLLLTILLFQYFNRKKENASYWLFFIKVVLPIWLIVAVVESFTNPINTVWYNNFGLAAGPTIIMSALPLVYLYYRSQKATDR